MEFARLLGGEKLQVTWWPCQYLQVFYPANSR